jgi:hypothetical protein
MLCGSAHNCVAATNQCANDGRGQRNLWRSVEKGVHHSWRP